MSQKLYNPGNTIVLAADPTLAVRAGDYYINSTTGRLRYTADGTTWADAGSVTTYSQSRPSAPLVGDMRVDSAGFTETYAGASTWVSNVQRGDRLNNLFGSNGDLSCVTGTQGSTSGQIVVARMLCTKSGTTTGAMVGYGTAGATLTSGQNFLALYSIDGATRLGLTADQAAAWVGAVGAKSAAWASSFAVVAGTEYWFALLLNGTTSPLWERFSNHAMSNFNLSGAALRWAIAASSQTSMPATLTPSGFTASTTSYAAAIY